MSTIRYKGVARTIASTPPKAPRAEIIAEECVCFEPGMEKIQVEEVLGAESAQRVIELDLTIPDNKPPIEQVIDVYIKELCIKSIDVIPNKVIVRGLFEVKVMYVADLPNEPVHAFEKHNIRWTRDIVVEGVDKDMPATADVVVEFVDYDYCHHHDHRQLHVTVVLKVWTRVTSTTEMDAYVLSPVDETMTLGASTTNSSYSASEGLTDNVSASQLGGGDIYGYGEYNTFITGPVETIAGTPTITSVSGTVNANNVNVRSGPGTTFPSITKVSKGAAVTVKEQAFGWYNVVLPDGSTTGWIASWLVDTASTVS